MVVFGMVMKGVRSSRCQKQMWILGKRKSGFKGKRMAGVGPLGVRTREEVI